MSSDLTSGQLFNLQGPKKIQMIEKVRNRFLSITYNSKEIGERSLLQRLSLIGQHRIIWKVFFEIDLRLRSWPALKMKAKLMLHISRFVWTKETYCRWFKVHSSSRSKLLLNNCWWPLMMLSYDLKWILQRSLVKNIVWLFSHEIQSHLSECIEWIDWQIRTVGIYPIDL